MNQQTSKLMLRSLNGETLSRPPFWFMRQAGRYLPEYREIRATAKNFLEFCYTPDLAVEVTLQPLRRLNADAAIMFSDILVIPDALGQSVEFKQGEGPVLEPVRKKAQIEALDMSGLHEHLAPVYEVLNRLSKEIPPATALIGFAGSPWTLAIYMVEGKGGTECGTARLWDYQDQAGFKQLIDLLVEAVSAYLIQQVNSGAEILQLFESWAGVLSEDQFQRLVIEPNKKIVEKVRAVHPHIPFIGFPRNAGSKYIDFVRNTGMNGVSIDHSVGLAWARDHLQSHVCLQGNLDNHVLMAGGEAMDRAVTDILETLNGGPFIFNLGHGVLPPTPPENVERVAELVRNWQGTGQI